MAARGLSRLDAGLGPVETKLEILAVLAGVGCGDRLRRLCLDGAGRAPVVVPATAAITRVPVRNGHRVGALAFSGEAVPGAAAVAFAGAAAGRAISLRPRHQHRGGIEAARLLVLREAAAGARQHVILVSDAECTSHNGSDEAWGPAGAPRGSQLIPWRMSGGVVDVARRAALIAASRCRRQRITVSVAHPDLRAQVGFADQLAEAGGGRARCLRSA